jgi:8-oxo-dGTP diphosphatase
MVKNTKTIFIFFLTLCNSAHNPSEIKKTFGHLYHKEKNYTFGPQKSTMSKQIVKQSYFPKGYKNETYSIPQYDIPFDNFFKFGVSVDCVVFGYHNKDLKILLIKRGASPYLGDWALPGDLVYPNEDVFVAANRILNELTGLHHLYMEQTKTYGRVDRHPAGRVITVGYYALIDIEKHDPQAAAWAEGVYWKSLINCPSLAFDHNEILSDALLRLRERVRHQPIGFELLPAKFTLGELQNLYEAILNETFDKANFRKRILSMGFLVPLKETRREVAHRPAKLYSFDKSQYDQLKSKGFSFQL